MTENKLALHGGKKVINYDLSRYNSIGAEEARRFKKLLRAATYLNLLEHGHLIFMVVQWCKNLRS